MCEKKKIKMLISTNYESDQMIWMNKIWEEEYFT